MGRPPCCEERGVKKGPWTPEEDDKLMAYIRKHGSGSWRTLPKHAGLNRCGKSCRLRWTNYLRPDIRRGKFTEEEEKLITKLHSVLGNKWSRIAMHLPGRTDNEIKNFWNTNLRKNLLQMGIDPETHKPRTDLNHLLNLSQLLGMDNNNDDLMSPLALLGLQQPDLAHQLAQIQLLQNLLHLINGNSSFVNNMQSIPPLLSNHNSLINNRIEADTNGTNSTLPNNKESLLREQEFHAGPVLFPSAPGESLGQDISESWTDLEGALSDQQVFGINNNTISRTTSQEIMNPADENPFSATSSGNFNQMIEPAWENLLEDRSSSADENPFSATSSSNFNQMIETAWENLLEDDDASDSYWKEILDLTST